MTQTRATPLAEHAQFDAAAILFNSEAQFDIRLRDVGQSLVRPFDKADPIACEIFIKPCIQEFIRVIEAIKIKVIQRYSRNSIRF